jgi:hypothetical protein
MRMMNIVRLTEEDLRDPARLARIASACQASSVWMAATVTAVPSIELACWQIAQLPNGDRHLVGCNLTKGRKGRVNSRIVRFDAAAAVGVTAGGRVYKLIDQSGRHLDANYVWHRWLRLNGDDVDDCVDVSRTVEAAIEAAQRGKGE